MKTDLVNAMLKLLACPETCNDSKECKSCAFYGKPQCSANLKQQCSAVLGAHAKPTDLYRRVTQVLHELGMPAHIKGFAYLRSALVRVVADEHAIQGLCKELYPAISKEFDTTPSRVERAMRHAIEIAWDRGDLSTLQQWFGYTVSLSRGKPTNREFIALVADTLRLERNNGGK